MRVIVVVSFAATTRHRGAALTRYSRAEESRRERQRKYFRHGHDLRARGK